jgi:hypothetical protein
MLLATALWMAPGPSLTRLRAGMPSRGGRALATARRTDGPDPLAVASCLDVLAVCLRAGMAVSAAAAAAAPSAPPQLARVLRRAADLLALGAATGVAVGLPWDDSERPVYKHIEAMLRLDGGAES